MAAARPARGAEAAAVEAARPARAALAAVPFPRSIASVSARTIRSGAPAPRRGPGSVWLELSRRDGARTAAAARSERVVEAAGPLAIRVKKAERRADAGAPSGSLLHGHPLLEGQASWMVKLVVVQTEMMPDPKAMEHFGA